MESMRGLREDQFCSLCSEEYESEKVIPKVLNCGHTFCVRCISELIIYLEACPTCNEPVSEPISNFPTNLALLEVVEEESENLKNLELKKKLMRDFLKQERQRFNKNFEIMKNSEESLNSCLEAVNKLDELKIEDPRELYNKVKEIEQKLRNIDFVLYSCYKPYLKAEFSLRSTPDKEGFINKIVVELLREKEMYAFYSEWFNEDVLWSRLCYKDGKLYIHSATSDLPKMPSLFVPLIDLKSCLDIDNFQTFINIGGNQIICDVVSSTSLSYDFVKLCSGEDGASFKGMAYEVKHFSDKQQCIISFKINLQKYGEEQGYDILDYLPEKAKVLSKDRLDIKMTKDKCIVINNLDLSSSEGSESDGVVVASATSTEAFLNLTEGEACIEDSGLILLLASEQQNKPELIVSSCD